MTRARRTPPDERKNLILDAAIKLSVDIGYNKLTRDEVAEVAQVSSPLVSAYFSRMSDLKEAVMDAAIERKIYPIIVQGILLKDPKARKLVDDIKQEIVTYVSNLN